ncbi:hypothetical protein [Acetobacterium woodii]|nr:hypothetical protein [Acetobacterium woodii]
MNKKILKSFLIGSLLIAGLILVVSGCGKKEVSTDPLNLYNKVQLGMLKEDAEKALEVEPATKGKGFNYVDENTGYGVTVDYDENSVVVFKSLYVPDDSYLDGLSRGTVTAEQVNSLSEGMSYDEVQTALGGVEGIEVNCAKNKKDEANPYSVMAWVNPDHSVAYITFLGIKGTVKTFEFRQP